MIDSKTLKLYKEIRKPRYSFYAGTGAVYQHQSDAKTALRQAIYQIKVEQLWDKYDGQLVRLQIKPDYDRSIDDLAGDSFNPIANPDINPRKLAREYQEFVDKVNREGVYGIISQYKCPTCGEWITVDSCWGFVGDDWKGSGYDLDVKAAALEKAGVWNE